MNCLNNRRLINKMGVRVTLSIFSQLISISACAYEEPKLVLPKSQKMIYSGVELTAEEQKIIRVLFQDMTIKKKEIYSKTGNHLLCYIEGEDDPKIYAVLLKDNLIYEGYFLDAWTERMEGKPSTCYKMTDKIHDFFESVVLKDKVEDGKN